MSKKRKATPRKLSGALVLMSFLLILGAVGGLECNAVSIGQFITEILLGTVVLLVSTLIYERSEL